MLKQEVWMCEACDRAPAAFFCKADAASLCATCDADIHSANPLARRHQRVPIYGHDHHTHANGIMSGDETTDDVDVDVDVDVDEDEAASWLILNPPGKTSTYNNSSSNNNNDDDDNHIDGEVDEYLDLFEYNTNNNNNNNNVENHYACEPFDKQKPVLADRTGCGGGGGGDSDSVVPVQNHVHFQNFLFGMEFDPKPAYNHYNNPSLPHSVSVSSMEVGVVPESSCNNTPRGLTTTTTTTIDLFSNPPIQVPTQLSPMDREARVMRYREKKKNRKFEKTIRYASRKAYAETRPRIKGRFAKRTDVDQTEEAVEQMMYPNGLMSDCGYGIVPSF